MATLGMLVDVTKCIGCRSCMVACKQWNKLPMDKTTFEGSYQNLPDRTFTTWRLVEFQEVKEASGQNNWQMNWHMLSHACMHCNDAPCVKACPVPGAMEQSTTGYVTVDQEKCIGCKYCMVACPFNIPKFNEVSQTVAKCTFCPARVDNGLTTACSKACPTGCITFGKRDELVAAAKARVTLMKERYPSVQTYGIDAYGGKGTNVIYVLKEKPEFYGLPKEPSTDAVMVWKDVVKPLTGLGLGATLIGLVAHAALRGRDDYREEEGGKEDE